MSSETIKGSIHGVAGPTVVARGMAGVKMHTVCTVGDKGLLAEVIRIRGEYATLQVYEDTGGLALGEEVVSFGTPLTVTLGPGILTNIFDGIQRPLKSIPEFIEKGLTVVPLDMEKTWEFTPVRAAGDVVAPGDIIGTIQETQTITHRVMVPPGISGTIKEIKSGSVSGISPVCVLEDGTEVGLYHKWPVRVPRPYTEKLPLSEPFITGQRVFDTLLPVAEGGTAIVPGGFGTGKTIVEQTIAKYGRTDIVIYVGCGERGNEMTEVLTDFPKLIDPATGLPLSNRTVIIVNTSNMPVAAREASIFTGVTIAEYFRDMGYSVALLADSLSRWAESLREISSLLEEMPGEEGFPPYLATHLGTFYERAGRVRCLGAREGGSGHATGAVTIAFHHPEGIFPSR
jgi:V/A-type H+-transporting ATPase subunit A